MEKRLPLKPSLSPFVAVGFVVIAATGILLFFHVKNGPIVVLHEWFGWAFVAAGLLHLALNLRPFLAYLRQRSGLASLALALALTAGLAVLGLNHRGGPHGGPDHGQPPPAQPESN